MIQFIADKFSVNRWSITEEKFKYCSKTVCSAIVFQTLLHISVILLFKPRQKFLPYNHNKTCKDKQ